LVEKLPSAPEHERDNAMSIIRQKFLGGALALSMAVAAPAGVKAQPVSVDVMTLLAVGTAAAQNYAATAGADPGIVAQLSTLVTTADNDATTYQANPSAATLTAVQADVTALLGYENSVLPPGIHRG
jgi:hypothetical protein